jgi:hypothetical protein
MFESRGNKQRQQTDLRTGVWTKGRFPSWIIGFVKNQSRKKASMNRSNHLSGFLGYLFDDEQSVEKAQASTAGILRSGSCRMSEMARAMSGNETANYKCIQRFVAKTNLKANSLRLYQEEAPFLIGDPTEMPRPEASKTEYVMPA